MRFRELDTVVLPRELPEHGLRAGDGGSVVFVHEPTDLEGEFRHGSGATVALFTPDERGLRASSGDEVLALRRLGAPVGG